MEIFFNQVPLENVMSILDSQAFRTNAMSAHNSRAFQASLPAQYCYKISAEVPESFRQDSGGDLINVAVDGAAVLPEYVASTNLVTPKYLVQAKKMPAKLVSGSVVCGCI